MSSGSLFDRFKASTDRSSPSASNPAFQHEIDGTFQPKKGDFFRTLEYPVIDGEEITGKIWMEAAYDEKDGFWTLWQKSIRKIDDMITGKPAYVMINNIMFPKTDFVTAYDQMTTLEVAQEAAKVDPMKQKSAARLGSDYYKQFAWREGLMMSRSGRLYLLPDEGIQADNFFNQKDIDAAKEFLARLKTEQFVPVPISHPVGDWAKRYADKKKRTEERLNALYARHNGDKNDYDLAIQIVGQEDFEVLYLHMQREFKPKTFEGDPAKHFALLKAAIDRPDVNPLGLLAEAGVSFYVSYKGETPVEVAMRQRRYSHLNTMLIRDGAKLVAYCDDEGNQPTRLAMELQDRQAFRMLYLEGINFDHIDEDDFLLIHRAFQCSFVPGVYSWLDEGRSIDEPIKGTSYTGLSIARSKNDQPMIDLAIKYGANKDVPNFLARAEPQLISAPAPIGEFTPDILTGSLTNKEIEERATAYAAAGGKLNVVNSRNVSILELCWKNHKADPSLDRRMLLPVMARLGADPAAQLPDGTTVLTRLTGAIALDMDFIKALAPLTRDVNNPDINGNNLLHVLQMNVSEEVSHSKNVAALLKLFPTMDINRQNADGLSNIGLALRLNRGQTLKNMPPDISATADFGQVTAAGRSLLDIAFTSAAGQQVVTGVPRAAEIVSTSDAVRVAVLDILDRIVRDGTNAQKKSLSSAFQRTGSDGTTLLETMGAEKVPEPIIGRLRTLEKKLSLMNFDQS